MDMVDFKEVLLIHFWCLDIFSPSILAGNIVIIGIKKFKFFTWFPYFQIFCFKIIRVNFEKMFILDIKMPLALK